MRWLLAALLLSYSIDCATPPPMAVQPAITDSQCLAWVIHDEARGEPLMGQRAVLDVVYERMKRRRQTACAVIAAHAQFSGYRPGVFEKVSPEMLTNLETVRKMSPVAANAEYFHATYVAPIWRKSMKRIKQVGKHIFYKRPKENKHERNSSNHR